VKFEPTTASRSRGKVVINSTLGNVLVPSRVVGIGAGDGITPRVDRLRSIRRRVARSRRP